MSWVIALLCVFSLLLLWQFVGYPLFMALVCRLIKTKSKDYSYQPLVSIVVPAYNEETTIRQRVENLLALDYPKDKYEILVVDSGSTDATGDIVQSMVEAREQTLPSLRFLQEGARRGKASAVGFAKAQVMGEIILVTDANNIFTENVLKELMPHFEDPMVGGVGGRFEVANPENPLASSASFYWDLEYLMRWGESTLGSACLFHGEINAWRKNLVEPDPRMLGDDLDQSLQIRRAGFRVEYEPDATAFEAAVTNVSDVVTQRKRTATGTIQVAIKHWRYLLAPRDIYTLLIFPSHKTLTLLSPFLLIAIVILYAVLHNWSIILIHFLATVACFAILLVILLVLRAGLTKRVGGQKKTIRSSLSSLFRLFWYVILNEYLLLLAWRDFVLGRYSVLWQQVKSTRA